MEILTSTLGWISKRLAALALEREKRKTQKQVESHKAELKKAELLYPKKVEATKQFISLLSDLLPHPMDWEDACKDLAFRFEEVEERLKQYRTTHGAVLQPRTYDRLSGAISSAGWGQSEVAQNGISPEDIGLAGRVIEGLQAVEKELQEAVQPRLDDQHEPARTQMMEPPPQKSSPSPGPDKNGGSDTTEVESQHSSEAGPESLDNPKKRINWQAIGVGVAIIGTIVVPVWLHYMNKDPDMVAEDVTQGVAEEVEVRLSVKGALDIRDSTVDESEVSIGLLWGIEDDRRYYWTDGVLSGTEFSVTITTTEPPEDALMFISAVDSSTPGRQELLKLGAAFLIAYHDQNATGLYDRGDELLGGCPTHVVTFRDGPLPDDFEWNLAEGFSIAEAISPQERGLEAGLDILRSVQSSTRLLVVVPQSRDEIRFPNWT